MASDDNAADRLVIEAAEPSSGGIALTVAGEPEPLVLPSDYIRARNLRPGVSLHARQVAELRGEAERFGADRTALRLLAMREHSEGELRTKLRRRGYGHEVIRDTIAKYRRQGAIDDARFAQIIGRSLVERRPCGAAYLSACLQRKHIDRALAEETARALLAGTDDDTRAVEALRQRWYRFGQFELERARRKAYNYLARRGFGRSAATAAFELLWGEQTEENRHQDR